MLCEEGSKSPNMARGIQDRASHVGFSGVIRNLQVRSCAGAYDSHRGREFVSWKNIDGARRNDDHRDHRDQ